VDPAVDGDLVHPGPLDEIGLLGRELERPRRKEEGRGDLVLVHEPHDAGKSHARSILALRERSDAHLPGTEALHRLVVDVVGQKDGDTRSSGPRVRVQVAAGAHLMHGVSHVRLRPVPRFVGVRRGLPVELRRADGCGERAHAYGCGERAHAHGCSERAQAHGYRERAGAGQVRERPPSQAGCSTAACAERVRPEERR